jgi:signal peptidase II
MLAAFAVAAGSIMLDQLTKRLVLGNLELGTPVPVLGGIVRFVLRYNEGAAFSFSWGGPLLLALLSAAAAILMTVFIVRCRECTRGTYLALAAVLGGALGNLIDRILYGKVIDFIDIGVSGLRWPTFNVADISICLGGAALLLFYRSGKKDGRTATGKGA